MIKFTICDNCGKINPATFSAGSGKLTKCCSTYDKNSKKAFYNTVDSTGVTVYSIGKARRTKIRFPFRWIGLFD